MSQKFLMILCASFSLLIPAFAFGQADAKNTVAGVVTDVRLAPSNPGVDVVIKHGDSVAPLKNGEKIYIGDTIETPAEASVTITLEDESQLFVGPASQFKVDKVMGVRGAPGTDVHFSFGLIRLWVKKILTPDKDYTVHTGSSVMGVRGTNFVVEMDKSDDSQESKMYTLDGKVAFAKNDSSLRSGGGVLVASGFMSWIKAGKNTSPATPTAFNREELAERLDKKSPGFGKAILESGDEAKAGGANDVSFGVKPGKRKRLGIPRSN